MKIVVYPADETGCGYYRLIWPAMAARARGHEVQIVTKKEVSDQFQAVMHGDTMKDVKIPDGADVLVFQRPTHKLLRDAIPLIRAKGVAVVVDMDDDLTKIDPRNPAFGLMHPGNQVDHSWSNVQPVCEAATLVTVSTTPLLDVYARRSRGVVIKNYVPHYFTQLEHDDSCVVGWGGSVHSHPGDLQTMGPAISRLSRETPFLVVGPELGIAEALGATVAERVDKTGPVDFLKWAETLALNLGVGVAPTADTKFNRAKSWLKPLEYAACAIPSVASDRPEYVELSNSYGVGLIASNPKDWYRTVKGLIRNGEMRREFGEAARMVVMNHLTIERNVHRWLDAWDLALRIQRS
jgi:glycosyltransferase involved in cell wall biosynthesis